MDKHRRMQLDLRVKVDIWKAKGWTVLARDPLILAKGDTTVIYNGSVFQSVFLNAEEIEWAA